MAHERPVQSLTQGLFNRLVPMNETPFELRYPKPAAGVFVVEVAGELDMVTSPQLKAAISSVPDGSSRVVIDLSETTFLDSSALNVLVHCQRELGDRRIDLRIVSPADRVVHRVFEITNLTGPLHVVGSLDDALV